MSAPKQRHRERDLIPRTEMPVQRDEQNGTVLQIGPTLVTHQTEGITDIVTPNYRKIIEKGGIVNNPCTYQRTLWDNPTGDSDQVVRNSDGYWILYSGGSIGELWGIGTKQVVDYPYSKVEARAKLVSLSKIDSTPYSFAEDAAEVRQTLQFLKKPLSSLAKYGNNYQKRLKARLKRTRIRTNADRARVIADTYAEVSWALGPLVRSGLEMAEALSDIYLTKGKRRSAHGYDRETVKGQRDDTVGVGNVSLDVSYTEDVSLEGHASILYYEHNTLYEDSWQHRLGLRSKDIPKTLWEIIPLSFMVDRMVDIGSAVSGLVNLSDPSIEILAGSYTTRSSFNRSATLKEIHRSGWTSTTSCGAQKVEDFVYNRKPWKPSASDAIPQLDAANIVKDAQFIMDLTAVVVQRFTKSI